MSAKFCSRQHIQDSIFHMNPLFCIIGSLCFKFFFFLGGGGGGGGGCGGKGRLSRLRGQMRGNKRTFERQRSGHLSEMENLLVRRPTCLFFFAQWSTLKPLKCPLWPSDFSA